MRRLLCITPLAVVLTAAVMAQGVLSTLTHLVRVEYLLEARGALRSAWPLDMSLPKYDFDLIRAGIEGSATVQFVIDTKGSVSEVSVTQQSQPEFGDAAKQAVAKWKFRPLKKPPTKSERIECKFSFELPN